MSGSVMITRRRRSSVDRLERGFTMIELMVVMSLIVVFASLALVQYRYSVIRAKEAVLKEDLFRFRDAIDQYHADKNRYPPGLDDLVTEGYLRQLPLDPMTDSAGTWQVVRADPQPDDDLEPGVYDVKSGSDGTAMDGTPYAGW